MTAQQPSIAVDVFRYDPSVDRQPRYQTFEVPYDSDMRVLDVLDYIGENYVGLGYRWFCGVKRCGMCGVSVNGKPVLACWEKASPSMTIDPLPNMPVIRDLVVDRSGIEKKTFALRPTLERSTSYTGFPERVTHREFRDAFPLMTCIECYVCTAACPVLKDAEHDRFAGPGSLVQLAKVALHPKDEGKRASLAIAGDIYACVSCYECSNACPVGINVLEDAIEKLKRICAAELKGDKAVEHGRRFAKVVKQFGRIHPPTLLRRSQGVVAALRKWPLAMKLIRRGKLQLFARAIPKVREIQKIFEIVGNKR